MSANIVTAVEQWYNEGREADVHFTPFDQIPKTLVITIIQILKL